MNDDKQKRLARQGYEAMVLLYNWHKDNEAAVASEMLPSKMGLMRHSISALANIGSVASNLQQVTPDSLLYNTLETLLAHHLFMAYSTVGLLGVLDDDVYDEIILNESLWHNDNHDIMDLCKRVESGEWLYSEVAIQCLLNMMGQGNYGDWGNLITFMTVLLDIIGANPVQAVNAWIDYKKQLVDQLLGGVDDKSNT